MFRIANHERCLSMHFALSWIGLALLACAQGMCTVPAQTYRIPLQNVVFPVTLTMTEAYAHVLFAFVQDSEKTFFDNVGPQLLGPRPPVPPKRNIPAPPAGLQTSTRTWDISWVPCSESVGQYFYCVFSLQAVSPFVWSSTVISLPRKSSAHDFFLLKKLMYFSRCMVVKEYLGSFLC
jgi:hypothetical protein